MIRRLVYPSYLLCLVATAGAEEPAKFGGAWKSDSGAITIVQEGDAVTGSFGAARFPIKGRVVGKVLTFEYEIGQLKGDATLAIDPGGRAFAGTYQVRGGRGGGWNGWRADPVAEPGPPADFAGPWLTTLGLMELTQHGTEVTGRYALRGTSRLEGEVSGRHLDFRYKAFRPGPGFFDLAADGKALAGASGGNADGPWYGWTGVRAPGFPRHAPLVAGAMVDGSTEGLLTYTARAPEGYRAGDRKRWPTVLILHGSNMNGRAYVNTIASTWPDLARDHILLGINGETPSRLDLDDPAFNYTYANYMGRSTYGGFPGTDRESPALVHEAIEDLRKAYPLGRVVVAGHSQGGFLAYALMMHFPESFAGAVPISAGLLMQCVPTVFDDEALKARQRDLPLAIVHGTTDPNVGFGLAETAQRAFLDATWPALRFFKDDRAGHMFGLLPVGPAIRWVEAIGSDDPKVLLDFADRRLGEGGHRDAIAAARRARSLPLDPAAKARADAIAATIDAKAGPSARTFLVAIRAEKDFAWVDDFLAFRDEFALADVARETMAAFDALRARQAGPARALIESAQGDFNQGRRKEGLGKAREVIKTYPASPSYSLAKAWLAEPG